MRDPTTYFAPDAPRFAHIQQVMRVAESVEAQMSFGGRLITAAAYHDIGYADAFADLRFHPVDSARLARRDGYDDEIVEAVLYHSGAWSLAKLTRPDLKPFLGSECRMVATQLSRALTFCDNRSGPNGESFTLQERLAEIRVRHSGNATILTVTDLYAPQFKAIDDEFSAFLP